MKVIKYAKKYYIACRSYPSTNEKAKINFITSLEKYALKSISSANDLWNIMAKNSRYGNEIWVIYCLHGSYKISRTIDNLFKGLIFILRTRKIKFSSIKRFVIKGNTYYPVKNELDLKNFEKLCELISSSDSIHIKTVSEVIRSLL